MPDRPSQIAASPFAASGPPPKTTTSREAPGRSDDGPGTSRPIPRMPAPPPVPPMAQIAVFCGSAGTVKRHYIEAAHRLGVLLAEENMGLVFGGTRAGMMDAVATGVLRGGGYTTGVVPGLFEHASASRKSSLVATADIQTRKKVMTSLADAIVILPGGIGTFDELTYLKKDGPRGAKLVILNTTGFYDDLIGFVQRMQADQMIGPERPFKVAETPEDVIDLLVAKSSGPASVKHMGSTLRSFFKRPLAGAVPRSPHLKYAPSAPHGPPDSWIGVFGGTSPVDARYLAPAEKLGRYLAASDLGVLLGGSRVGVLGTVEAAVLAGGGHVKAVFNGELPLRAVLPYREPHLVPIVAGDTEVRKQIMGRADAFVVCPGGWGTLDEFATLVSRGRGKKMVFLNTDGFFDHLHEFFERVSAERFMDVNPVVLRETPKGALKYLLSEPESTAAS